MFNKLGLPRSSLNKGGEPVVIPKGTILGSLGTIKLAVPCRCNKPGCRTQEIQFNVIKGLMEQGIISNSDGWRLGWIQEEEDSQADGPHKEQRDQITNPRNIPPGIRRLVEENPERFKSELAPEDKIDTSRIQGFKEGVRLDIEDKVKPEANFATDQVPAQYRRQAQELYQDWIRAGLIRTT